MGWDSEDWNDEPLESERDDYDLQYEQFRDEVLAGHAAGCRITKCICGRGTLWDPVKTETELK